MNEPSILDYLKSRLNPWQKEKIEIPQSADFASRLDQEAEVSGHEDPAHQEASDNGLESPLQQEVNAAGPALNKHGAVSAEITRDDRSREITIRLREPAAFPWRTLLALLVALFAQRMLEVSQDAMMVTSGLFILAMGLLTWAYFDKEFVLPVHGEIQTQTDPQTYHRKSMLIALLLSVAAFILFSNNLFTRLNVSIWLAAIAFFLRSLWLGTTGISKYLHRVFDFFSRNSWQVSITRWTVLLVVVIAAILFFRFYRLDGVPGEPFSDHAEKLLDVYDVTQGQTKIFFPRNTGREFIQFYLTAIIAYVFGTGLSFLSLKIGTVLIGLFTLPYIYLIGREVGGKRVALFALVLAGTSYWLNTISRIGLRFPLYPAFTAPALYYLIRGLHRQNRNDFILSGLFLGLGLHGYSPFRFVPFLILLGVGLYLLHKQSQGNRKQTLVMFTILVLASFLVFLPLMRYAVDEPARFSYRALTRLTGEESPLPAPAWQVFGSNMLNAMLMFNYDNGEIWVHSIPHRPALDMISAVLFLFGYIFLFVRYLRKRDWLDLFLFLSVPMLLMPSILSLAFPAENPSLNRTGGAAVVVFVVAGMALDSIYMAVKGTHRHNRQGLAVSLVFGLLLIAGFQNYNLVFNQFSQQFLRGAWNTADIGRVIRSFVAAGNNPDNAFVVPYPYWVDTRLVGIQAGYLTKDYALWRDDLPQSQVLPGNKLFIVKEDDLETLAVLANLYPAGLKGHFTSPLEGKNFWIYTVTGSQLVNP